jgi:DNA invertase Pin-like site-specific DNA recombinase
MVFFRNFEGIFEIQNQSAVGNAEVRRAKLWQNEILQTNLFSFAFGERLSVFFFDYPKAMDNINLQTKKIFLYARKSTDEPERQVLSIEAQMFELREYAKKENLNIVREFVESKTAKEPGREIFNEMIASIEKNEAEGILAWHPDRLARNSIDGGRIIYLVDTGKITTLKFPTFWFDPTPQGKFMLSIAFGQSKYYIDNLSENIKRGIRQKLRNWIWPAWAPLGYINDKNARCIAVDKERAKYIKRAFEMYSTGEYPLAQIRKIINSIGLVGKKGKMLSVSNYQHAQK